MVFQVFRLYKKAVRQTLSMPFFTANLFTFAPKWVDDKSNERPSF